MLLFEVGGNKRTTKTFDKWLTSFTPRVATMTMSYLTMCVCVVTGGTPKTIFRKDK